MKEKQTKEKKKIGFVFIFRLISLIIILICLYSLYTWNLENNQNANLANSLISNSTNDEFIFIENLQHNDILENSTISSHNSSSSEETESQKVKISKPDFNNLLSKNSDTVGWIMINNTNINYPIVKSSSNNFYLKHNFNGEYNSAGWIFADYRNSFNNLDKNTIIYGHNRRNNTMFSNLKFFLDSNWNTNLENRYFSFSTINQNYIAEIFSVYKANSSTLSFTNNFESIDEFNLELTKWKNKSIYNFSTNITTSDKVITLCTCDDNNSFRIVIHAKLIPLN